ncbi:MAG: efflux RND transporter periplasmic adaptor subunit [Betaproteobacteria bacterium]|nr:MAG: efflux RND transporter periplasmic adaptor subunit [Betaproteobacteria bacterium]
MESQPAAPAPAPQRSLSRRSLWIGSLVALLALAVLGGLAWSLTRPASAPGSSASAGPGGGGFGGGGGRGGRGAPPTTVGVAVAERADIPVTLEALGTVVPAATVTVRPQVSGVLQQLMFREGQMVKVGQLLAQIDPRPFEMTLMQALGQRQRDEAQLENAKLTLQRYRTLLQQDSIARQDVDTQAALVKQLEGTLTTDRANEGTARLNLGYSRVVAPISGRLGLRVVDIGNVVSSNDANGIAVITQLSPIDVEFAVPQDRVPELQARLHDAAAMPATAYDRTRTKALDSGSFAALDNQVDTQTGTVKAKARFANAAQTLFPSQFVNVQLLLRSVQGAVVVPVNALRHGGNGDYVFVLNEADRTVSLRPVTRGIATVDKVQIASGLDAGQKVITEGADRLKDGARVVLPGDRPASGAASGARRGFRASDASAPGADGASWPRRRRASDAATQ